MAGTALSQAPKWKSGMGLKWSSKWTKVESEKVEEQRKKTKRKREKGR